MTINWNNVSIIEHTKYTCAYCDNKVAPSIGFTGQREVGIGRRDPVLICVCPNCNYPTFYISKYDQIPNFKPGNSVSGIEDIVINDLFNEARNCMSVSAFTATILICRKILMNIAVHQGAEEVRSN